MKQLKEDLKSGQLKKVYLLYGDEPFLIRSYKAQLRRAAVGEDTLNVQVLSGKGLTQEDVISAADMPPMFAERRYVQVEDSGFCKKDGKELAAYLAQMPDTTVLVFVESEVDKRNALYKQIGTVGHAAEMPRQTQAALEQWSAQVLARAGKRITSRDVHDFVERCGDDMFLLRNELDKLIGYTGDRDTVTQADLDAVCAPQIQGRIFDMISAISRRDRRSAMALYADLASLREPPMRILSLVTRQYQQLLLCADMLQETSDQYQIARTLGVQPFVAGKLKTAARGYTREELRRCVEACVQADEDIKSGNLPDQMATEILITQLSRNGA